MIFSVVDPFRLLDVLKTELVSQLEEFGLSMALGKVAVFNMTANLHLNLQCAIGDLYISNSISPIWVLKSVENNSLTFPIFVINIFSYCSGLYVI